MPYADPKKQRAYLTEYARKWYAANAEKERARQKAWRDANKDRLSASQKKYRSRTDVKEQNAVAMRNRRAANPQRNLEIWRKSHYKTAYGLTVEQYEAMFAAQDGKCALCRSDKPGGRWARFCIDHCHKTGRVRGLLCINCNSRLGSVESWFLPYREKIETYIGTAPALRAEDFTQ